MNEIKLHNEVLNSEIFNLFKIQLKRDFENCSVEADFVDKLPPAFEVIRNEIKMALKNMEASGTTSLNALLYRIDISEQQITNYLRNNAQLGVNDAVAELIIKRVLQKVILKKKFSN